MKEKKILVVGGAGYIGGAVVDQLLQLGFENIRVYDSLLYEVEFLKPVPFVRGDIRDIDKLFPNILWADSVIWLAALVGDGACAIDPKLSKEINQDSVEWFSTHFPLKRFIFMSTCSVYGAQDGVLDEFSETKPLSVYAATKLGAEKYLQITNSLVFRLGTVFGKGDNFSRVRFDLVLNGMTLRAATQGKLTVFGGDQFRPLIHVRDVAKAVCENVDPFGVKGIYNLVVQNVRIVDLAYQVRNHFPDCKMEVTEMTFEDSRNYRATSQRAIDKLGFAPVCTIDQGINEIKELITSDRIKDPNSARYSNHSFLQALLPK